MVSPVLNNIVNTIVESVDPQRIEDVLEFSDYAIQARYPGDYYPVTKVEYEKAIKVAGKVPAGVKKVIKENQHYIGKK